MTDPVDPAVPHPTATNGISLSARERNERRIASAVQYIQANYRQRMTLDEVAGIVGMGRFSLSRNFRAVMQVPFRTYVLRMRVATAAKLLEQPDPGVTEVAQLVGFGDLSRFNKMFKKYVGLTPTAHRKRQATRNAQK